MTRPGRIERGLIAVGGPDARPFLQNLLTQDLDKLDAAGVAYAALLSPQGKVNADMFVWERADGLLLDVAPSRGADLLRRLSIYKLRANVTLADVSAEHDVLISADAFDGAVSDPRLAALGYRAIAAKGDAPPASLDDRHIAAGVPDLARDAQPEEVFAGEALLEELNGVAFDKGCFVGQENVSRMKRRATTRKKFCPVVFEGEGIAFGTPVLTGEAEIGSVRTGVAGRAIALLRLDRALDAARAGANLTAADRQVRLDAPPWLIVPRQEDGAY
ncbi:MAG: folate-binding protein YgfZ [Hyphomonadaceae bacterium]|nr:folate-binding protein YgfZ [Hyphomonadaceae bacterium]